MKKLIYLSVIIALLSCSNDVEETSSYLNGTGKTPIETAALLDVTTAPLTRAANKDFAENDQLLAYLRHVTWNGGATDRNSVSVDQAPCLVTFIKGTEACIDYSGADITPIGLNTPLGLSFQNTKQTSNLTPTLYWDDFSNETNDLRSSNHYLQSFYGYCYNGGTPSDALTESTGVLGWTVPYDQTQADALKHADLLWSAEQTPIKYDHAEGSRGKLVLPYTHAMSMVTVVVTAAEGFSDAALTNTWLELQGMNRTCKTTAPTYEISNVGQGTDSPGLVKMALTLNEGMTCTYRAIVVPQTVLTSGNSFLKINGAEDNNYEVKVTQNMLDHWASGLSEGKMQSGYNYQLNVTINKVGIDVSATITNWNTVEATGTGEIKFQNDVTTTGPIADELKVGGMDIYKSTSQSFDEKSTTLTWDGTNSTWTYSPTIYWAGQGDASYFRALSPAASTTAMAQGNDVLWGFACDADADISKVGTQNEVKITPRTGDVSLRFRHAMSKITVQLVSSGEAAVVLTDALISITNLANAGTLDLVKGTIQAGEKQSKPIDCFCSASHPVVDKPKLDNYCVIPQSIGHDAVLTVKLADGTTYSLPLNTCKDSSGQSIATWEQGRHYVYTITLTKGSISFRALIKEWEVSNGEGDAELDWD